MTAPGARVEAPSTLTVRQVADRRGKGIRATLRWLKTRNAQCNGALLRRELKDGPYEVSVLLLSVFDSRFEAPITPNEAVVRGRHAEVVGEILKNREEISDVRAEIANLHRKVDALSDMFAAVA